MHHSKNTISLKSNLHLTNELICLEEYVNVIYQKTWHIGKGHANRYPIG
jgi:hypothetical protein